MVERWFGHITDKAVRSGTFASVADLERAIEEFLQAWNKNPKPFVWTASIESIMEKVQRAGRTLEGIKPGCTKPRGRKQKEPVISATQH